MCVVSRIDPGTRSTAAVVVDVDVGVPTFFFFPRMLIFFLDGGNMDY